MAHIHEKIDFTVAIFVVHKGKVLLIHHRNLNKWLPGDSIEVGAVGTLRNFLFTPVGHLRDFGIEAATSIDNNAKPRYEFTHNCAASEGVAGAGSGNAVPGVTVSAAVEINFSAEHAVFFRLENCVGSGVKNLNRLGQQVLSSVRTHDWPLDYFVEIG